MDRRWNDGGAMTTGSPVAGELAGSWFFFFRRPHVIAPDFVSTHHALLISRRLYTGDVQPALHSLLAAIVCTRTIKLTSRVQVPGDQATPLLAEASQGRLLQHSPFGVYLFSQILHAYTLALERSLYSRTYSSLHPASTSHCTTYAVRPRPPWHRRTSPHPSRARSAGLAS
jgi:hypothetical protein